MLRDEPDWPSAILAGLAGGGGMAAFDVALLGLDPLRRIAAIVIGPGAMLETSFAVPLLGLMLHLVIATVFAIVFEPVMRRLQAGPAVLACAAYGGALYALDYHGATWLFPWFVEERGGVAISAHMTYGAVMGAVFARLRRSEELAEAR